MEEEEEEEKICKILEEKKKKEQEENEKERMKQEERRRKEEEEKKQKRMREQIEKHAEEQKKKEEEDFKRSEFEVSIAGEDFLTFSLNLTQQILEIQKDKTSKENIQEHTPVQKQVLKGKVLDYSKGTIERGVK